MQTDSNGQEPEDNTDKASPGSAGVPPAEPQPEPAAPAEEPTAEEPSAEVDGVEAAEELSEQSVLATDGHTFATSADVPPAETEPVPEPEPESEPEPEPAIPGEETLAEEPPEEVDAAETAEELSNQSVLATHEPETPDEAATRVKAPPSSSAPEPGTQNPEPSDAAARWQEPDATATDEDDGPPADEDPDHSELITGSPDLEEEVTSSSIDDETFHAITTLEYLPGKKGEDDDDLPRFSSVGEARAVLEGFLFTTNEPLSVSRLSRLCGNLDPRTVRGLVLELQMEYDGRPGGLQVVEVAGGFQLATRPHIAEWMFRLHKHRRKSALSPATLETLAIIAYKQPATKGEVEAIRGVESSGTFRTLQDLNLIDVGGRREVPGRPQLYVTSPSFLKAFGLNALADLPSIAELRHRFADEQKLKAATAAPAAPSKPEQEKPPTEETPELPSETEAVIPEGVLAPEEEGAGEPVPADAQEEPAAEEEEPAGPAVPFSEEEVTAAIKEARQETGPSSPAAPPPEQPEEEESEDEPDDADYDEDDYEDDEDFEDEIEDELEEEESDLPPEEEETSPSPEDDIPPPPAGPVMRVPKPPRKGGWGIGRPMFGDEDEEE